MSIVYKVIRKKKESTATNNKVALTRLGHETSNFSFHLFPKKKNIKQMIDIKE